MGTIHFHHEPNRRRGEVRDVAPEHDLPTKHDAERPAAKLLPEPALRLRSVGPHVMRAG